MLQTRLQKSDEKVAVQGSSKNHEVPRERVASLAAPARQRDSESEVRESSSSETSGVELVDVSPVQAPNLLLALCIVARLHNIAAEPQSLLHFLGKGASEPLMVDDLLLCAKHIGLKAVRSLGAGRNGDQYPCDPSH